MHDETDGSDGFQQSARANKAAYVLAIALNSPQKLFPMSQNETE